MNPKEICSLMHGFAKMQANWEENMSTELKKYFFTSIVNLARVDALCLPCVVYSMGLMKANWNFLPQSFRDVLAAAASTRSLRDQEISNTIYGLCLMQVTWVSLGDELRGTIVKSLSNDQAFAEDIPQHISNTLWALAKMDAAWNEMPTKLLEKAFCRCSRGFSNQVRNLSFVP